MPELFLRGTLCSRKYLISNFFLYKSRYNDFLSTLFCRNTEQFREGTFKCFRINKVLKNFMDRWGRYQIFCTKFLPHGYKQFRAGVLVFQDLSDTECFSFVMQDLTLCHQSFPGYSTKLLRGGSMCFRKIKKSIFKTLGIKERLFHNFLSFSCLKVTEHSVDEVFCV